MPQRGPSVGAFALLLSVPAAVGIALAFVLGGLAFWIAVACWLIAFALAAVFARRHVQDLGRIDVAIDDISVGRRTRGASYEGVFGTPAIGLALERLSGAPRSDARVLIAEEIAEALPGPFLLLARDRRIVQCNGSARELVGDDPVGRFIAEALRDPVVLQAAETAIAEGKPGGGEFSIAGTVTRHFLCHARPIAEAKGDGPVAVILLEDVTEARKTERMRADFVANASHEIRTPLASVAGFIETLIGPAKDDAPARERFLTLAAEQVARIQRLVDDLLSLSRIEVREHTVPTERLDIGNVLRAAVGALAHRAKALGVELVLDIAPALPPIAGDGAELDQVFQNLVGNALDYGAGKPVRVSARLADDAERIGGRPTVVLSVIDQGPGIAREHLPRLTERFYRVDPARSRRIGGTGLGLAIVKHIVNRHRGQLAIRSEIGHGSDFSVYLPILD